MSWFKQKPTEIKEVVEFNPISKSSKMFNGLLYNYLEDRFFHPVNPHVLDENEKVVPIKIIQVKRYNEKYAFIEYEIPTS